MSSASNGDQVSPDRDGGTGAVEPKFKASSNLKVRRRNRMITSCLECRRRKLKCDKLHPCTNCNKFARDCMFLAPALDSVSQQRLNEIKEKMGSLEKVLEQDVARRGSKPAKERKSSVDLPGDEESSSDNEAGVPEDEKGLKPTPLAVVDGSYEDDADDDVLDLGIKIGKMRMTERLGGFFRPKMTEELGFTLSKPDLDDRTAAEKQADLPQLQDDALDFLQPGPSYIAPSSGFLFGDVGQRRNLIDFLPTKAVADLLIRKYYENAHFLARVVHWPSFQLLYDNFWTSVLAGLEPPASQQAMVLSIMFCSIASLPENDVASLFGQHKRLILSNFQTGTEIALSKAQFLRATKIETLQALVVYLIPMCRDQMSRAHSVLVGTAIRLAECMGLHRDPADVYGLPPVECQVRRMIWFQLCFLDFRTGETQGPRPCIKREDYDTRFPLNIDDSDLTSGKVEETNTRWTDMTLSRIRFECTEMHRIIWYDRIRLEKEKISLTHVLGKIESFRKAMEAKYAPIIDQSLPIQKYAQLVMQVLLLRMHIMVLHRYRNHWSMKIPDRLVQIIMTSGTAQMEAAVEIDRRPEFAKWRWYSGAHQQYHTAFLLLVEVYQFPNRREADRIWNFCDFVFEPDLSLSRTAKARSILAAVKDRTAVYRDLRRIRAPLSMRTEEVLRAHGQPVSSPPEASHDGTKQSSTSPALRNNTNLVSTQPSGRSASIDAVAKSADQSDSSWGFDTPSTFLLNENYAGQGTSQIPGWGLKQQTHYDTSVFQPRAPPPLEFSSPSEGSGSSESWPPLISDSQSAWRMAQALHVPQSTQNIVNEDLFRPAPMGNVNPRPQRNAPHGGYPAVPIIPGALMQDDALMLDIDWNEWDKIFPPEQNNGNLDISPSNHG